MLQTPDILSDAEYRQFWMDWQHSAAATTFRFGNFGSQGEKIVIHQGTRNNLTEVNYISFRSSPNYEYVVQIGCL